MTSPVVPSERLTLLKDSTIARLLVSGKLPSATAAATAATAAADDVTDRNAIDLSNKLVKPDPDGSDDIIPEMCQEMARLIQVPRKLRSGAVMKCRYCPYGASDARTLYSHYQFHQQVLANTSAASRAHLEWMAAYRRDKGGTAASSPPAAAAAADGGDAWWSRTAEATAAAPRPRATGTATLLKRALLDDRPESRASASGCLRSIVQTIMQSGGSPVFPTATAAATTTARASPKVGIAAGDRSSWPGGAGACEEVVIKVEVTDATSSSSPPPPSPPSLADCPPDDREAAVLAAREDDEEEGGRGPAMTKKRAICRLAPRVNGTPTPMLRAMLGKRRRRPSADLEASQEGATGSDAAKTAVADVATQCAFAVSFPLAGRASEDVAVQCSAAGQVSAAAGHASDDDGASGAVAMRCAHCGVTFEDEVLHSLHMGCHSHRDPYICNVCGRHCKDRYGFYTHIMRGHQA